MLDKKIKAKIRHPASSASDQVVSEEAAAWAGAAPVQRLEAEAAVPVRSPGHRGRWLAQSPARDQRTARGEVGGQGFRGEPAPGSSPISSVGSVSA